jgi:hypothetical protein
MGKLQISSADGEAEELEAASQDLMSITRARLVEIARQPDPGLEHLENETKFQIDIEP